MSDPASGPVSGGATTGVVNPVELEPFAVRQATVPQRFDPSANNFNNKLPLSFVIWDPNALIRSGRILYTAMVDDREVILKRTRIPAAQLLHGPQVLPVSDQWTGEIAEGLEDRVGEFITADLSPVTIYVQVWNNTSPTPEAPLIGHQGRTRRGGEWLSRSVTFFDIDCIVRAVWERNWCVPYQEPGNNVDPGDEGKGQVGMTIEVKNVREDTPVQITVSRIGAVASPGEDLYYTDSNDVDRQPGLQSLIVQNQKVFCPDSSGDPYVRFVNYEEHWTQPGNNFYCFSVAFGPGAAIVASERDWENNESACLHLRFTVVVICSASASRDPGIHSYARQIHNLFKNDTRYYRSYLFKDPPSSVLHYLSTVRRRYIVFYEGHAAAGCSHWDHPKRTSWSRSRGLRTPDQTPVATGTSLNLVIERLSIANPTRAREVHPIDISTPELNNLNAVRDAVEALAPDLHPAVVERHGRYYLICSRENYLDRFAVFDAANHTVNADVEYKKVYRDRFDAEQYACPVRGTSSNPRPAPPTIHGSYAGCGNASHVEMSIVVKPQWWLSYVPTPDPDGKSLILYEGSNIHLVDPSSHDVAPRFLYANDGCRGSITTEFGKRWVNGGTRYYGGWCYVTADYSFYKKVFRSWLFDGPTEYDREAFAPAFQTMRQRGQHARYEPRLMDSPGGYLPLSSGSGGADPSGALE